MDEKEPQGALIEGWIAWLWMQEKAADKSEVEHIKKLRSFLMQYAQDQGLQLFEV